MPKPKKPHDVTARVVRALMEGRPANATGIAKAIFGDPRHRMGVIAAIEKLRAHQVVRVHSYDSLGFANYEMQRYPGALPDMPPPPSARADRTARPGRTPRRYSVGGELLTAREIAEREGVKPATIFKRLAKAAKEQM